MHICWNLQYEMLAIYISRDAFHVCLVFKVFFLYPVSIAPAHSLLFLLSDRKQHGNAHSRTFVPSHQDAPKTFPAFERGVREGQKMGQYLAAW